MNLTHLLKSYQKNLPEYVPTKDRYINAPAKRYEKCLQIIDDLRSGKTPDKANYFFQAEEVLFSLVMHKVFTEHPELYHETEKLCRELMLHHDTIMN